jgi:hypothetical protein
VQSIIAFISDFGLGDTWVGVCHAVIHRACPQARVVDLAHGIAPFDVRKAAAVAAAGVYQLPEAIHLVVVDPGVGGGRRDLCLETTRGTRLVGPDNGVLLPAAARAGGIARVYAIDSSKIDFRGPLPTFHARDILAPAAAALACGVQAASLGTEVDPADLAPAPFGECRVDGSAIVGEVLESDRFGSLRFNIPAEAFEQLGIVTDRLEITLGHNSLTVPLRQTYSDVEEGAPLALVDSSGWLTLSVNMEDAADRYGVGAGATVRVRPLP